jgi:hypothetical protein
MIINDLNLLCAATLPSETDAVLVVDANAILASPVAV